jgi:flagellar protein FlaG
VEKTITTALLVIAAVVATVALINAVLPAVGKSSSALSEANSEVADRIKTDVEIVLASGNTTGDVVTFWAKNVGSKSIKPITKSDVFLQTSSSITRIPYTADSASNPRWSYTIEGGGSSWDQSVTLKVVIRRSSGTTGLLKVIMSLYNSVSAEKEFSI